MTGMHLRWYRCTEQPHPCLCTRIHTCIDIYAAGYTRYIHLELYRFYLQRPNVVRSQRRGGSRETESQVKPPPHNLTDPFRFEILTFRAKKLSINDLSQSRYFIWLTDNKELVLLVKITRKILHRAIYTQTRIYKHLYIHINVDIP